MKIILLSLLLILSSTFVLAQEKSDSVNQAAATKVSDPLQTKKEKEQIARDAQKLTEDFGAIITDLSSLGQKIGKSFVDTLSLWINENYKKISESQRKRLKKFVTKMKEQLRDLEQMSVKNLSKILKDLKDFLNQLQEGEAPAAPEEKSGNGKLI